LEGERRDVGLEVGRVIQSLQFSRVEEVLQRIEAKFKLIFFTLSTVELDFYKHDSSK
jgi:hypothetical protein